MVIGIPRINFDMTLESWFADEDPAKFAFQEFRKEFGSNKE